MTWLTTSQHSLASLIHSTLPWSDEGVMTTPKLKRGQGAFMLSVLNMILV